MAATSSSSRPRRSSRSPRARANTSPTDRSGARVRRAPHPFLVGALSMNAPKIKNAAEAVQYVRSRDLPFRSVFPRDDDLFPGPWPPQAHPLARGGVRAHQGPERIQVLLTDPERASGAPLIHFSLGS